MTEIEQFFAAWAMEDSEDRTAALAEALAEDAHYADPRTEAPLSGIQAISDYIGMFSANAPGAIAEVVKRDEIQGMARVTIAFRMPGGMEQLGQYFVTPADGKIAQLTGFVGTGAPE